MLGADWWRLPVIVLGAGRGKRMGGPKALMEVTKLPWWSLQLENIFAAGVTPVWVMSSDVRAVVQPELDRYGIKQPIVEADPDRPMFDSIRAGIRFLMDVNPRGLYILPIDVPAPHGSVWRALAKGGRVAAPTYNGEHGHPVYLDWSFVRTHIPLEGDGDARLDELIAPFIRYVSVKDPDVICNLNTPEAVRAYEEELLRRGPLWLEE